MTAPAPDLRGPLRRARDEQIASDFQMPISELPTGALAPPVEAHLAFRPRPIAVVGIVENGLVAP